MKEAIQEYETLSRELAEMIGKSFTFKDIEAIGQDIFGKYSTHKLEGLQSAISISTPNAAKRLVTECRAVHKTEMLLTTLLQLEGNYLNGKRVKLFNIENLLYHIAQSGAVYDYKRRKFMSVDKEKSLLLNWGSLRDGTTYNLTVASVDIAGNSKMVVKYGTKIMEKAYQKLWGFLRQKLAFYDGRIWSWQGDGGLFAFPHKQDINISVVCCMEILCALPVHNLLPDNPITQDIVLRIALDHGKIKFFADTGRIVSETINYAAHLEKNGTEAGGISASNTIYEQLTPRIKKKFTKKHTFEGRKAYSAIL